MRTLNQVRLYLSTIPRINAGGCAISALAMYRWLKKKGRLNWDTAIVYTYTSTTNPYYMQNSKAIQLGKLDHLTACCHAYLLHGGCIIDCDRVVPLSTNRAMRKTMTVMTEEQVVASLNIACWNAFFQRKPHVTQIAAKLRIDMRDIKRHKLNEHKIVYQDETQQIFKKAKNKLNSARA